MKPYETGRISGIETLGALDGPGLRTIIFLQGCHLRCVYCHNPETWQVHGGKSMDSDTLFHWVCRYKPYFGTEGGVTVSGGEPLLQPEYVLELFKRFKGEGIHTAVDTAGVVLNERVLQVLEQTDLVILDVKMPDAQRYKDLIGGSLGTTLDFMKAAAGKGCRIWVRHVVVPGITDTEADMAALSEVLQGTGVAIEKIEVLPYHKMGLEKYRSLGIPYRLQGVPDLEAEALKRCRTALIK